MTLRRSCMFVIWVASLSSACAKDGDPVTGSSSGSTTQDTTVDPTTGDGSSTSTGASSTGGSSSETGPVIDEDMLCADFAAHFVECFPDTGPVSKVEKGCHDDIDAVRDSGADCVAALLGYFGCQAITPCDVFEDSCLDEANLKFNTCGA